MMEISKHGQKNYRIEADLAHPEGCTCETTMAGDCGWCLVYYDWDNQEIYWKED